MADTNIALELARAAQVWPNPDETMEDYSNRLMHGVDDLSEDEFYGMPQEAQDWQENALIAHGEKTPLPELEGFDNLPMNGEEKPVARVAKPDPVVADAKRKTRGKGKKESGERKTRQLSGKGKVAAIADAMIANPDASVDDIRKHLSSKGLEAAMSSVPTFRSAFRNVLSRLSKAGKLKDLHITY